MPTDRPIFARHGESICDDRSAVRIADTLSLPFTEQVGRIWSTHKILVFYLRNSLNIKPEARVWQLVARVMRQLPLRQLHMNIGNDITVIEGNLALLFGES